MIYGNIFLSNLCSLKLSKCLKKYLPQTDCEWTKKILALDPPYAYFHPSSLALLLIVPYSHRFSLHSPYLFLLPLSICFPLRLPAAGNGTYRLWPDGDDGQAVPAQDHHCWHQRLCPPHWLRPHQEGGQERGHFLCVLSSLSPAVCLLLILTSAVVCTLDFSSCVVNVRKGWSSSNRSCLNGLYSNFFALSLSKHGLKKRALPFQLHKPDL